MPTPTNDELQAEIERLQQAMALLATASQVETLLAALNDYKTTQAAQITDLYSKLSTLTGRVNNLESRVQALESP